MRLGTRSRIAITAAVLSTAALLGPSGSAAAYDRCTVDWCYGVVRYYTDSTYTVQVGEWSGQSCENYRWGETTHYYIHTRVCD